MQNRPFLLEASVFVHLLLLLLHTKDWIIYFKKWFITVLEAGGSKENRQCLIKAFSWYFLPGLCRILKWCRASQEEIT